MLNNNITEFLADVRNYKIFSYNDYKNSSMNLKLLKIKLLNEYYRLKFANFDIEKLPVYIDYDGVILDTMGFSRKLLLELYGIDYYKHSRDNVEQDKIVGNFFATIDWNYLLDNSDELSCSSKFLSLFRDSIAYKPTIYSAVSSDIEERIKRDKFLINYSGIESKFISSKLTKECDNNDSVLVDDSDFYLVNWPGKPVHFESGGKKSMFFDICDLGELYYLFPFSENRKKICNIDGLYDEYVQEYDENVKRLVWKKR